MSTLLLQALEAGKKIEILENKISAINEQIRPNVIYEKRTFAYSFMEAARKKLPPHLYLDIAKEANELYEKYVAEKNPPPY